MDHDKLLKEISNITDTDYRLKDFYLKKAAERAVDDLYFLNGCGISINLVIEELSELGTEISTAISSNQIETIGMYEEIIDVYLAVLGIIRHRFNNFKINNYTTEQESNSVTCNKKLLRNKLIYLTIKELLKSIRYFDLEHDKLVTYYLQELWGTLDSISKYLDPFTLRKIALIKINRANRKINSKQIDNHFTRNLYCM